MDQALYPFPREEAPGRDGGAVEAFLTHLAVDRKVSASTQNQAMSAILFLYKEVLGHELEWLQNVERAKRPVRMPVVLSGNEVRAVLARLEGRHWLMASLLYGAGLRLMECVRSRVKDVDFEYAQITVRDGKGEKDRVTMLPGALAKPVKEHLQEVKAVHEQDLRDGGVFAPCARPQVPQGRPGVGVAVCVCGVQTLDRSTIGGGAPPSYR